MEIRKIRDYITVLLYVIVVARIAIMIFLTDMEASGSQSFIFRQIVYTLAWGSLVVFFMNFRQSHDVLYLKRMKNAAFVAMVLCFAKAAVTLYSLFPYISDGYFHLIYDIAEICAWFTMSGFLGVFWWNRRARVKTDKLTSNKAEKKSFVPVN